MPVRFRSVDAVWSGLRATSRQYRRRRWHMTAIVIMLAAGIGASTAVFSLLHQVLLEPTGIADPSRLVEVYQTTPPRMAKMGITVLGGFPFAGMLEQRAQNRAFRAMAMTSAEHLGFVVGRQEAQRIRVEFVSA